MAGTILNYLKEKEFLSLNLEPFNEVDSLILAQFSYLKFDGMVPGIGERDKAVTLQDIFDNENYDNLYADERYRKNNTALFEAMLASERFNRMRIHSYVSELDWDKECQFSAVTIEFEDGTVYVAFRGTDENFVGWKEDMNLALSKPIPGQLLSVKYLEKVAKYLPEYFKIGGHSKGGNLAMYSAMYASPSVQERITDIYNHDGPGFRVEIMNETGYQAIKGKIRMTVPHSSLVGMLLNNFENYRVVDSRNPGAMQHDPFSWKVEGNDFVLEESVKNGREIMDRSINEWVMTLPQDQIERFLDTTYEVMMATGVDNLNDLYAEWKKVVPRVAETIKSLDDETKFVMMEILGVLMDLTGLNHKAEKDKIVQELKEYQEKLMSEIRPKVEESVAKMTEISGAMAEKAAEVSSSVAGKAVEVSGAVVEKATEMSGAVVEKATEMSGVVVEKATEMSETVKEKTAAKKAKKAVKSRGKKIR